MRSPLSIKEVQDLAGRMFALSKFMSCAWDKAFHFFTTLRKRERFMWTHECEKAFQNQRRSYHL